MPTAVAFIGILVLAATVTVEGPAPVIHNAQTAPDLNSLFERKSGWIGGDGACSVLLASGRVLWLFSDTWVGEVRDGKRFDATIVNNTPVIQEGIGKNPAVRFIVPHDANDKPAALLIPKEGGGWFWPQAAFLEKGRLYLFLTQVEKTATSGAFGFRLIGQWLGIVSNSEDAPTQWRVEQVKLPVTEFLGQRERTFGAAVLKQGEDLYIYGVEDVTEGLWRQKHMILARVPVAAVADFSSWRFYREGRWLTDPAKASHLVDGVANDYSVSYLPGPKCFVLVCTENGLSPKIIARTAPNPWGPWSAPALVYKCPEAGWDRKIFCYGAKAHPELAREDDELVINYVANSFDFWQVAADARLYWPRFIRAKLGTRR
jgi:hypothetical protein